MMKRFVTGLAIAVVFGVVGSAFVAEAKEDKLEANVAVLMEDAKSSEESNVGNGEAYRYLITTVDGNQINGIPTTKASDGNRGIFLYADEVDFKVVVGDELEIVWGEYEDEFKSITRVIDGTVDTAGNAYKFEDISGKWNYEVTDIEEDGIVNGKPLNRISDDNTGIFLYPEEVDFDVKVGDKIEVTFGDYADEINSVKKVVMAEDGSYVPVDFYNKK